MKNYLFEKREIINYVVSIVIKLTIVFLGLEGVYLLHNINELISIFFELQV